MRDIKISRSSHGQEPAYSLRPAHRGRESRLRQVPKSAILMLHMRDEGCAAHPVALCLCSAGTTNGGKFAFTLMRFLLTRRTLAMEQQ